MYEQPDPQDPNQEREETPFPANPNGPPRYAPQPQGSTTGSQHNQQLRQQQPYAGNGNGVSYALPPFMQQSPQQAPQQVAQQGYPQANGQPDDLVNRLRLLSDGFQIGSLQVGLIWATHLQMFRQEYQQKTGQYITDREAFEIVTTPLLMAFSD